MRAESVSSEHDSKDKDSGGDDNRCNETTTTATQRTVSVKANTIRRGGGRQWHGGNNQESQDDVGDRNGTRSTVTRLESEGQAEGEADGDGEDEGEEVRRTRKDEEAYAMVIWREARTMVVRVEDEGGRRGRREQKTKPREKTRVTRMSTRNLC